MSSSFRLPTAEDDMWSEFVTRLLWQKDISESQAQHHLRLLEELGFHKEFCHKPLTDTFVLRTATWLAGEMKLPKPGDKARKWLQEIQDWQLLLSGDDAIYEFPISGLDEYFAARHLAARWAEDDKRYRGWLASGDRMRGHADGLICPDPYCHKPLSPFRDFTRQSDFEETLLLMVGLLKKADREEKLLKCMQDDLNLALKTLSRCRTYQPAISQRLLEWLQNPKWGLLKAPDGLEFLGRARLDKNLKPIFDYCVSTLRHEDKGTRVKASHALMGLGEPAIEPLIAMLDDPNWEIRYETVIHLCMLSTKHIGEQKVLEALVAMLEDRDWMVRDIIVWALECLRDVRAIPALERLRNDPSDRVRNAAQRAIEEIRNQARPMSL